jgi:hypothetical protein
MGAIPRRAGFEINFDINPQCKNAVLFSNNGAYPGGMSYYIEDGMLKFQYWNQYSGITAPSVQIKDNFYLNIPIGKWSRVKISYNLKNVRAEVNGHKSQPVSCPGPAWYDAVTTLGCATRFSPQHGYFKGMIKNLTIKHAR